MKETTKLYCKNCGKELIQTEGHRQKEFCCDNCRKSYWHKKQCNQIKKCPICGREFLAKDPRAQYCSDLCRLIGKTMKTIRTLEK